MLMWGGLAGISEDFSAKCCMAMEQWPSSLKTVLHKYFHIIIVMKLQSHLHNYNYYMQSHHNSTQLGELVSSDPSLM